MEDRSAVLLVEDDELIISVLRDPVEQCGYDLKACATVFDALNYMDMEPDVRCLITDIVLSDGSNGWELAEIIRSDRPDMPVIYITGASASEHGERGVRGSLLLQKPFQPEDLCIAIKTATGAG